MRASAPLGAVLRDAQSGFVGLMGFSGFRFANLALFAVAENSAKPNTVRNSQKAGAPPRKAALEARLTLILAFSRKGRRDTLVSIRD